MDFCAQMEQMQFVASKKNMLSFTKHTLCGTGTPKTAALSILSTAMIYGQNHAFVGMDNALKVEHEHTT